MDPNTAIRAIQPMMEKLVAERMVGLYTELAFGIGALVLSFACLAILIVSIRQLVRTDKDGWLIAAVAAGLPALILLVVGGTTTITAVIGLQQPHVATLQAIF